jgi:hypothetical protein
MEMLKYDIKIGKIKKLKIATYKEGFFAHISYTQFLKICSG